MEANNSDDIYILTRNPLKYKEKDKIATHRVAIYTISIAQ